MRRGSLVDPPKFTSVRYRKALGIGHTFEISCGKGSTAAQLFSGGRSCSALASHFSCRLAQAINGLAGCGQLGLGLFAIGC